MNLFGRSKLCCFCCEVKVGTVILLFLDLIYVFISTPLIYWFSYQRDNSSAVRNYGHSNYITVIPSADVFFWIMSYVNIISFFFILAGIYSLSKLKPNYLIPYCVWRVINAVLTIWLMLGFLYRDLSIEDEKPTDAEDVQFSSNINDYRGSFLLIKTFVEILFIALQIHFAKVVYSCYEELCEMKKRNPEYQSLLL